MRKKGVTVQVCRTWEQAEAADREFWRKLSAEDRILQTWRLSEELWRLKGEFPNEPRFLDMLRALLEAEVRFLIVGAYALNLHTKPRATGDLDIWVEPAPENAPRVMRALKAFGAPLDEITEADFTQPGVTFQIGIPPVRIDLLTQLTALEFNEAWQDRVEHKMGPYLVSFLEKKSLIKNKRAIGRHKDLADVESLEAGFVKFFLLRANLTIPIELRQIRHSPAPEGFSGNGLRNGR